MTVLADAPFYAPLETSLIPQNGSGIPSFTRTTARTVLDNEDKLITLPSGAVAFEGARYVINRLPSSTDFTSFTSAVSGLGSIANRTANYALDPDGEMIAYRVNLNLNGGTTSSDISRIYYPGGVSVNRRATIAIYLKTNDGNTKTISLWWGASRQSVTVTGSWTKVEFSATSATDGTLYIGIRGGQTPANSDIVDLLIAKAMLLDTTGQANYTGDEFVSKGILSAPYHGCGVDGVKAFATNKDGSAIPKAKLKRAKIRPSAVIHTLQYIRDFTNAVWTKNNVTAQLNQTGIDGQANACSLLTATANGATVYQTITAAAAAGCSGYFVRRAVGTGNVYFTRDNFATLLDITAQINAGTFSLAKIENTSVLNPTIGFKFDVSGDAIIADYGTNHLGTEIASPALTTNAAVTVNAETLTYQLSGNFSDTAGTIIATIERGNWANNNGVVVGKAGSGLSTSSSNSGAQALDGTNTVNGPAGSPPLSRRKIGMKWSGSTMKTFAGGNFGSSGSYDGSFNLTTIAIMPQSNGNVGDVAIWPTALSDADMLAVASEQTDCSMPISFATAMYASVIYSASASMPFSFVAAVNASVIHSVSAAMDVDFAAAMYANVIHSVSADMSVSFGTDFEATWISPAFTINATYEQPVIMAEYSQPVIVATYNIN